MPINIPEHIIKDAAESALRGAFVGSPVAKNSNLWWIEAKDRKDREADAPKGVEKARLVRPQKSDRSEKSKNRTLAQPSKHRQRLKAENLYTAAVNQMTPEQRLQRLGLRDGERMDFRNR